MLLENGSSRGVGCGTDGVGAFSTSGSKSARTSRTRSVSSRRSGAFVEGLFDLAAFLTVEVVGQEAAQGGVIDLAPQFRSWEVRCARSWAATRSHWSLSAEVQSPCSSRMLDDRRTRLRFTPHLLQTARPRSICNEKSAAAPESLENFPGCQNRRSLDHTGTPTKSPRGQRRSTRERTIPRPDGKKKARVMRMLPSETDCPEIEDTVDGRRRHRLCEAAHRYAISR